jgi:DNA-binding MarR family transcriptional regulator
MPPFDLDSFLPYRLSVAAARVSRRLAARLEAEAGLSNPEWRVLAHLARAGSVSVRDIHVRVDLDKSRVSRAAARLEAAGLVAKLGNEADRRLVALSLTEAGKALMGRLERIAERFQADLREELGDDAAGLDAALDRIARPTTHGAP